MQHQANSFSLFTLHSSHSALHTCTSHSTVHLISNHLIFSHLTSPHLSSSQLFSSLPILSHTSSKQNDFHLIRALRKFISTHLSSSARQKALTVRNKNLLHKKHCAQRAFAHRSFETQIHLHRKILTQYFVLQSLHEVRPSTTLYYELLCTTKLAQSTSQ